MIVLNGIITENIYKGDIEMKYIRTKDNRIIDTKKYYIEGSNLFKNGAYQEYKKELANAYKQANTIEELCDAFVDTCELKTTNTGGWLYDEFDSDNKCLVYYEHDERKTIPLNEFDDLSKIRGAIWTDKGLIYVAKMNDKGELELL